MITASLFRSRAVLPHIRIPVALAACILTMAYRTPDDLLAAILRPPTIQAWDRYLKWADEKVQHEISDKNRFLIENYLPDKEREAIRLTLESGRVIAKPRTGVIPSGVKFEVPDGEIHHWWGAVLVPEITLPKLMEFLQDYDHHAGKFADVEKSKLIAKSGNRYTFFFRLRRTKAIVSAYYNTEQQCTYTLFGSDKVFSHSTAIRIAELENPGTPEEREKPPGHDRGFLWRLESWWRFQQTDRGVIVELESASLSRDIPAFIKLIPGVSGYIRSTPRESLESVLLSIKAHAK